MELNLTETIIDALENTTPRQDRIYDQEVPGLFIVIDENGDKTWGFTHAPNSSARKSYEKLGYYPDVSLNGAREAASQMARRARPKFKKPMSDGEIVRFWKASNLLGYPFGAAFQFLLLTGQRPCDVMAMRWSEVEHNCWIKPMSRCSRYNRQIIPLPPTAISILGSIPRKANMCDFIFTTNGRVHISGLSRPRTRLIRLMDQLKAGDVSHVSIAPLEQSDQRWRVANLHVTVGYKMAEIGIGLFDITCVLKSEHFAYDVERMKPLVEPSLPRITKVLCAWDAHVQSLISKHEQNALGGNDEC